MQSRSRNVVCCFPYDVRHGNMRLTHPTNLRESSVGGKPLNSNISSKYYFQIYIVAAVVLISDLCSLEKLNLN